MPPSSGPRTWRSSRAFLVRAADMGEADRRVSFFTEADGLVTLSAKSARRSRRRFGGALQRYFLLDIAWTESAGRMGVLEDATVLESFWGIVTDWEKVRHGDYLLELAAALFPQHGRKSSAFGALLEGFRTLSGGAPPRVVARKAEAVFLAAGGWGPNLSECRRCGAAESGSFRFVPSEGRLLCGRCSGNAGIPISLGAVKTWRALQATSSPGLRRLRIPDSILIELQDVIIKYLEWNIGIPFRSLGGAPPSGKA